MPRDSATPTEVFKALSDPIRWTIVQLVAQEDEYACSLLEDTLPVSKPTISYHTKILTQAGLLEVRKRGRNYFYSLRREVLRETIGELWALAPGALPAVEDEGDRGAPGEARAEAPPPTSAGTGSHVGLVTW
ncbi:metalloregulator ArsR/SmtB family transcription factor [Actinomadura sp. 7K507]|uniref:ArsR/SmtB family transcription factor n=1 Tax=Actinomadura sp. 7K507 TaxID=2530365 RepID=UPI001046D54A|nr:metalloregulator ArsR/SmtB family transcription factor [Actinomadura sp. 7K507]TDC85088.1 transcriptional regulator [Actinomadura sp. 7K507]